MTTAKAERGVPSPAAVPDQRNATGVRSLPPRRAIAGLAGFQISSRIVFTAAPEKPHDLSAIYLFPDRVRIRLSLEQGSLVDRVLFYRIGEQGFSIDERSATSRELESLELAELRLQTELRRALFLWPDGFSWQGEGSERSVELAGIGKLALQLGSDGKPSSIRSSGLDGRPGETLQAIEWKNAGARTFPSRFELHEAGELISTEEILKVETALNYVDAFFFPPDRRAQEPPSRPSPRAASIEALDVPLAWELRVELDAKSRTTIQAARAAAAAARSDWERRGIASLAEAVLELDREARPIAAILRTQASASPAGEGWIRRAECPAWALQLERVEDADATRIASLLAASSFDPKRSRIELHASPDSAGAQGWKLVLLQH
ncbi:MAG TPA: hypothetical protein VK843_19745 [Planctomycetota bacterium]|nr:hypothetical protein [Planctomycetota bacterium]